MHILNELSQIEILSKSEDAFDKMELDKPFGFETECFNGGVILSKIKDKNDLTESESECLYSLITSLRNNSHIKESYLMEQAKNSRKPALKVGG